MSVWKQMCDGSLAGNTLVGHDSLTGVHRDTIRSCRIDGDFFYIQCDEHEASFNMLVHGFQGGDEGLRIVPTWGSGDYWEIVAKAKVPGG